MSKSKEFECDWDGCENIVVEGDDRYIGDKRVCPSCESDEITIVDVFAEALSGVVRDAINADVQRYGKCRSFADLHDVCDANEFIIEVCETLGAPFTNSDWVGSEPEVAVVNYAVAFVNKHVFTRAWQFDATYRIVRDHIFDLFPNAWDHAGIVYIEWGDTIFMFDREMETIRLGAYQLVDGEYSEEPHIWLEFRDPATVEQIIGIIDALTDLP